MFKELEMLTAYLCLLVLLQPVSSHPPPNCRPGIFVPDPDYLCGYYDCDKTYAGERWDGFVKCPQGYRVHTRFTESRKPGNPCTVAFTYQAQNCLANFYDDTRPGGLTPVVSDPCSPNPCENGGTCQRSGSQGFVCDCPPPFTGRTCCNNECVPNPCVNGGVCRWNDFKFGCECPHPYTNSMCQVNSLCNCPQGPGVTCRQINGQYQCLCDDCFLGNPQTGCFPVRSCRCTTCPEGRGVTCVDNAIGIGECRCATCYTGSPETGCTASNTCQCTVCPAIEGVVCREDEAGRPMCVCDSCYEGDPLTDVCRRKSTCECISCPVANPGVRCIDDIFGRGQCFCDVCFTGSPQIGCIERPVCACMTCEGPGVVCRDTNGRGQCVCDTCHSGSPQTGCTRNRGCACMTDCPVSRPGVQCVEDRFGVGICSCQTCYSGTPAITCLPQRTCGCTSCPEREGVVCREINGLGTCVCEECYTGSPATGCVHKHTCDCISCPTENSGVRCIDDIFGQGQCFCDVCYTGSPQTGCLGVQTCSCMNCPNTPGVRCVEGGRGTPSRCECDRQRCYTGNPYNGCSVDPDCVCQPCLARGGTTCTVVNGRANCQCAPCYRGDPRTQCRRDLSCACSSCPREQPGVECVDDVSGVSQCRCQSCYQGNPLLSGGCSADRSCRCMSCQSSRGLECRESGGIGQCFCRSCYIGDPRSGSCSPDLSCRCKACGTGMGVGCADDPVTGVGRCTCTGCYRGDPAIACTIDETCLCNACTSRPGTRCVIAGATASCQCRDSCYAGNPNSDSGCLRSQTCACMSGCDTSRPGVACVDSFNGLGQCSCREDSCYFGNPLSGVCSMDESCMCRDCLGQPNTVCRVEGTRAVCECNRCYRGNPATGCNKSPSCSCMSEQECPIRSLGTICVDSPAGVGSCRCDSENCYSGTPGSCEVDPICKCRDCLMRPGTRCGVPGGELICECSACYYGNPEVGCAAIDGLNGCLCNDCLQQPGTVCDLVDERPVCSCDTCFTGTPGSGCKPDMSCRCMTDCPVSELGVICYNTPDDMGQCACDESRCYRGDPAGGCRLDTACLCKDCTSQQNTICDVVNGQPQCMCADCYTGSPGNCEPVSTCSCLGGCRADLAGVECVEREGRAGCECSECYEGNPLTTGCTPIARPTCECLSDCPTSQRGVECVNQENGVGMCRCEACYTGTPRTGCVYDSQCPCRECESQSNTVCRVEGAVALCECTGCYTRNSVGECVLDDTRCECLPNCPSQLPEVKCEVSLDTGKAECMCENCFYGNPGTGCQRDRSCRCMDKCRQQDDGVACTDDSNGVGQCSCESCYTGDPFTRDGCTRETNCNCVPCPDTFQCFVVNQLVNCDCPRCYMNNGNICVKDIWSCECNPCPNQAECQPGTILAPAGRTCTQSPSRGPRSRYTFVFMDNDNLKTSKGLPLEVYVSAPHGPRTIRLYTPGFSPSDSCYRDDDNINIAENEVVEFLLNNECLRQKGTGTKRVAIHVYEKNELDIQVFGFNKEVYTTDGFGAIGDASAVAHFQAPTELYYRVVCYKVSTGNGLCQFAVVAFTPGQTTVTVTLTQAANGYDANREYNVRLQQWDSLQIQSTDNDLSGSQIRADRPVNVFAGSMRALVTEGGADAIPATSLLSRDHMVEQLTPVTTYGREFVLVAVPRSREDFEHSVAPVVRLVSSQMFGDVEVEITKGSLSSETYTIRASESVLEVGLDETGMTGTSAYRILVKTEGATVNVAHFVASGGRPKDHDPAMMIVPSAPHWWGSSYLFQTPLTSGGTGDPKLFEVNFILVVIAREDRDGLVVEVRGPPSAGGVMTTDGIEGWVDVPGRSEWSAVAHPVAAGVVKVYHPEGSVFQCMFYGGDDRESYGLTTHTVIDRS